MYTFPVFLELPMLYGILTMLYGKKILYHVTIVTYTVVIYTFWILHLDSMGLVGVCSALQDGTVRIWEWARGQLLHTEVCSQAEQEKVVPVTVAMAIATETGYKAIVCVLWLLRAAWKFLAFSKHSHCHLSSE